MGTTYVTKQGETIDLACWRHYGRTRDVVEAVLAANADLSLLDVVLPIGTRIVMPDITLTRPVDNLISLWD
ncbi:Hypothetical protein NGAL_HAMBI1146_58820 [Neorhizobium galegae bv. officinalis]|nr:Hypothetical protein NGAL_HAMBI1146_58820 [Neorhizobium galegae bv. officinalis]